jgi:hypothetical protein
MKERPILMSGPLVREILAGHKDVTRRPVKNLRVRLRHEVASDLPDALPRSAAGPGVYAAEMNQHGAVAIRTASGRLLGVKPSEFDFLCPYADGHTYLRTYPDGRALWNLQPNGEQRLWVRETFRRFPDGRAVYRASLPEGALDCHFKPWTPGIHMPRWACRLVLDVVSIRVERLHEITEEDARREGVEDVVAFALKWSELYGNGDYDWNVNPWVWRIQFRRAALVSPSPLPRGEAAKEAKP